MSRVELRAGPATADAVAAGEREDEAVAGRDGAKEVPPREQRRPVCRIFEEDLNVLDGVQTLHGRQTKKILGVVTVTFRHPGSARPSKPGVGPEIAPAAGPRQRNCCPASAWDDPEKSFLRPVRLETWGILRF